MRRLIALLLILLACALPGWAEVPASPTAMVTDLVGRAADKQGRPLRIQALLRTGDQVRLEAGGRMRLVFMQGAAAGRLECLSGPCLVEVGPAGARLLQGKAGAVQVERQPLKPAMVPGGDLSRMAGLVTRNPIKLTMRRAMEGAPRFSWACFLPGLFTVSVLDGDRVVWSTKTEKMDLAYAGPALREDYTYSVRVELAEEDGPEVGSETGQQARFRIVSREVRQRLAEAEIQARKMAKAEPGDPTPAVLMMALYLDNLMLEEATPWAREAARLRPEEPGLRDTLLELEDYARLRAGQAEVERGGKP